MTPSILIVGAGIGGLTLAHCLSKRGIEFELVERAAQGGPVGAGISLTINAVRLLDGLGIGETLRKSGHCYQAGWVRNDRDAVLQHLDLRPLSKYGEAIALHRAELHAGLAQGLSPRYGTEVTSLRAVGEHVEVTIQGKPQDYDLVVAADGLHSRVRRCVAGSIVPTYSGYTSWRCVQPDPLGLTEPVEYWGAGRRLGLVPIGKGQLYVFATFNSPPLVKRPGFPTALFETFPAPVRQVMANMPPVTKVIQTDINELKTHVWRRPNVAFLGDAAHGMTPNLGQGAGMAIEDAVVLAECLYRRGVTGEALRLYEEVRQQRVQTVARQSRLLGLVGQLAAPPLTQLRDWALGQAPTTATQRNTRQLMLLDAPQPPRY